MPGSASEITHVSDTALMVAACRARETERADGFVRDPFAARLAGERGVAILRGIPSAGIVCFGIGIRSRFLDELLLEALAARPVATVLNVGCGLDTRPSKFHSMWRRETRALLRLLQSVNGVLRRYWREHLSGG